MVICKVFLSLFLIIGSKGNTMTIPKTNNELEQISTVADFEVLFPHYSIRSWKVEIKNPYPVDLSKPISMVRLHFFDKSGTYVFGVMQHKAVGYKYIKEITKIDVKENTMTTKKNEEEFTFDYKGESVLFNGIEARFETWADDNPGGILRWMQDGTYVEIDSMTMPKKYMIKLAKSMK